MYTAFFSITAAAIEPSLPSEFKILCSRFELDSTDLKKEVSNDHIRKIYSQLRSWKRVAFHLRLTETDIEALDRQGYDEKERRLQMLLEWKKQWLIVGSTYHLLLLALLESGDKETAIKVAELLSGARQK